MDQVAHSMMIRRLGADDAAAFSALRREVTRENPVPMGLTFEEELTRTLDGFRAQLSSPLPNAVFGCFIEGKLAATAAISRAGQFPSSQHKMVMWGVFTSPRLRRRGLSRQVVEAARCTSQSASWNTESSLKPCALMASITTEFI